MPARRLSLDELASRFNQMASVSDRTAAIGTTDANAAAYARVLEYGSVAGQRPWPRPGERTVAAMDPETGAQVVVSVQAPQGLIRVRAPEFLGQLREAIASPANWLDAEDLEQHFTSALQIATTQTLQKLRDAVPRDSGHLAQSLTIVDG